MAEGAWIGLEKDMSTVSAPRPESPQPQRILAAAIEDLRHFGPERTTVVSVAKKAGMTHANVYRHFETKIALFDAITLLWLKPVEGQLSEIGRCNQTRPDDKLERLVTALVRAYRRICRLEAEPVLFDLFVTAFADSRPLARHHRARVRTLIDRVIEEGQTAGAFPVKSRDRALTFVLDGLYRFLEPEAVRGDGDFTDEKGA
jgi:AcrR family transcriptional regulator